MADRFWVGGTGAWDDVSKTHWAASSGGASGASVPTADDNVFINPSSGISGGTITVSNTGSGGGTCKNLTCSVGSAYTIGGTAAMRIYGSISFESNLTFSPSIDFYASTSANAITSAGVQITNSNGISFLGIGGWTLQGNLTTSGEFYHENGTFNANGFNVTANDFYFFGGGGLYPIVNMDSGTWTVTGHSGLDAWVIDESESPNDITINPGTSTIKITDSSSSIKKFHTYELSTGKIYNNVWFSGSGTGAFVIEGDIVPSNTFNDFKVDTPPHTVRFQAGSITTVSSFTVSGTLGNLMTLLSDISGTPFYLYKLSGVVSRDYLSLQDSHTAGEALWFAGLHSTNVSGNYGWSFSNAWSMVALTSNSFSKVPIPNANEYGVARFGHSRYGRGDPWGKVART